MKSKYYSIFISILVVLVMCLFILLKLTLIPILGFSFCAIAISVTKRQSFSIKNIINSSYILFTIFLLIIYGVFEIYAQRKERKLYEELYEQSIRSTIEGVGTFNKTGIQLRTNNNSLYFYTTYDLWLRNNDLVGDSIIKESGSDTLTIKHNGENVQIVFIKPVSLF